MCYELHQNKIVILCVKEQLKIEVKHAIKANTPVPVAAWSKA
jgi:hypothetical protein